MKKFFEKYDLLKISGILVLVTVVLSWILPYGMFSGSELVTDEITRIGLTDFFNYGVLGMFYFTVLVTFLFVMGGFYQVLSKRAGYQKLVKTIGDTLKTYEIPVVLFVSLIFAILGSLVSEYFPLLAIIPFVIAILNKMKVDKITAFVATFGGLLVGTIGSTYSTKITGWITQTIDVTTEDILTTQSIIFVIAFVLLSVFTVLRITKTKKDKKFEEYDLFVASEVKDSKTSKESKKNAAKVWPYATMMALLFLTVALAYLPWETWEVTLWSDITTWINEFSIGNHTIFSYIFGSFTAFGEWDIYTVQFVMLAMILLIHWFGKMSLDEVFESFGEGIKKIGPTVAAMLMVYFIVELAVMYPVVPTIVDWLGGLADGANAFLASVGVFITSVFSGEIQYAVQLTGTYYASAYATDLPKMAIIFQTMFGFVSFFVPSSVILMMGLSYLDIKYKDWMKFIWKFLLAMLVAIVIIIAFIA